MTKRLKTSLILLSIVVAALLTRVDALGRSRVEGDEQIYLALSRNLAGGRGYNLAGTEVLRTLPPSMYERPLFHHPPLYAALLIPFSTTAPEYGLVLSWLGLFLCGLAVYSLLAEPGRPRPGIALFFAAALAFDPVLSIASRRLWMDCLLSGWIALSFLALSRACRARRLSLACVSGGFLALACWTKAAALVLLPIWGIVCMIHLGPRRGLKYALALSCIVLTAVAPWFLYFYQTYGVLLPTWTRTTEEVASNNAFLAWMAGRSRAFYLLEVGLVYPGLLVASVLGIKRAPPRDALFLSSLAWLAGGLALVTLMSHIGRNFQMRFLAYILPAIYLAAGSACQRAGRWGRASILGLWVVTVITGVASLDDNSDEVFSLFERVIAGQPLF